MERKYYSSIITIPCNTSDERYLTVFFPWKNTMQCYCGTWQMMKPEVLPNVLRAVQDNYTSHSLPFCAENSCITCLSNVSRTRCTLKKNSIHGIFFTWVCYEPVLIILFAYAFRSIYSQQIKCEINCFPINYLFS